MLYILLKVIGSFILCVRLFYSGAAKNKQYLRRIGITHVLNTAEGNKFGMVNTNRAYYRDTNIKYMGVQLEDLPLTNISIYFEETADFIESGVKSGGNYGFHIFINCSLSSFRPGFNPR